MTDLLAKRLSVGGVASDDINTEISNLLSWDLRAGTRMDVNRPFGNGQDDNGNGVVDEHGPISAQQLEADPSVAEQVWAAGTYFDHDNDGNGRLPIPMRTWPDITSQSICMCWR